MRTKSSRRITLDAIRTAAEVLADDAAWAGAPAQAATTRTATDGFDGAPNGGISFLFEPTVEVLDVPRGEARAWGLIDRHGELMRGACAEGARAPVLVGDSGTAVVGRRDVEIDLDGESRRFHLDFVPVAVAGTAGGKLYALGAERLEYLASDGAEIKSFEQGGVALAVFANAAPVVATEDGAIHTLNANREFSQLVAPPKGKHANVVALATGVTSIIAAHGSGKVRIHNRSGELLGEVDAEGEPRALTTVGRSHWALLTEAGQVVIGDRRGVVARFDARSGDAELQGTQDGRLVLNYAEGPAEVWQFPSEKAARALSAEQSVDPEAVKKLNADLERRRAIAAFTERTTELVGEIRGEIEAEIQNTFDPTENPDFQGHARAAMDAQWPATKKRLNAALNRKKADREMGPECPAFTAAFDPETWADWAARLVPDLTGGETFETHAAATFEPKGGTAKERALKGRLIANLARVAAPADARDEAVLKGLLDALTVPMLEALEKAGYTIAVSRHRITNSEKDLAGIVNDAGGVATVTDHAEGIHRLAPGEKPRIAVRSYWKNGEIRIDAGALLHEIGHAFDRLEAPRMADALHEEGDFAKACEAEYKRLDPYFHVQHEFFAETFSYYMLDPERCARQFPKAFAALDKRFRMMRPNAKRIHEIQNASRGKVEVDVRPDPRKEVDRLEQLNAVRAKQELATQPYILTVSGPVGDATNMLADEIGGLLRWRRSPQAAPWRSAETTISIDAATFDDPKKFQEMLDEQASSGRGALLYVSDLGNIRPDAPGFALLDRHIERFGGLNPLMLAGSQDQLDALQGALPTVMRREFELRGLTGEQMAELVVKTARDEGYELSQEAHAALREASDGGTVLDAQQSWRRIKTAHTARLSEVAEYIRHDPSCVSKILAADVAAGIEQKRERNPLDVLDEMVGLHAVKTEARAIIAAASLAARQKELGMPEDRPRLNLMFAGNPGTGKTTVAELLAEALYDIGYLQNKRVAKVRVQDLTNGDPKQNVKKLFEENKGAVIFVDEIHQLLDSDEGRQAFRAMIPYLGHKDYLDTVFIGAGYPDETRDLLRDVDAGAERRFSTVPFEDYTKDELGSILDVIAGRRHKVLDAEARGAALDRLDRMRRKMKHFGNGGSVDSVIDAALKKQRTRLAAAGDPSQLEKADLQTLIVDDFAEDAPIDRDAIWAEIDGLNGLEGVKDQLREIAALAELAEGQGRSPLEFFSPYFVFRGPPGAGREQVARLMGRMLHAYDIIPTHDMVDTQGAKLQGRFVGQTAGDVEKVFESAWGGVLFVDRIGGLAKAGGAFKEDAVKEMVRQMKANRGRFAMVVSDDDDGVDAFLDLDGELSALLDTTIAFDSVSAADALLELRSRLEKYDLSAVESELSAGMSALAEAPRWAGFEDARSMANRVVKAHATAYVARRKKGEAADANTLLPEAVERAFAQAIQEKQRRGEQKAAEDDGLAYGVAVQAQVKAVDKSAKQPQLTPGDHRIMAAVAKADQALAALFDADPKEQSRQEADPNSEYHRLIAEELGMDAEAAMQEVEATKVKIRELVTIESVVKKFEYHCPYCGGVDSPSCGYINYPLEWKIEHSLKKPWTETKSETKVIEREV